MKVSLESSIFIATSYGGTRHNFKIFFAFFFPFFIFFYYINNRGLKSKEKNICQF